MTKLFTFLERVPQGLALIVAVALAFLIAVLDYVTGFELSFTLFYLLPIALAGWTCRRWAVLVIALLGSALNQVSYFASGGRVSSAGIIAWNSSNRVVIFSLFGLLVYSVHRLLAKEQDLARTDPLTGLINRRGLEDEWQTLDRHHRRHPRPLCLAIVDLDHFKLLNDEQGHAEGDQALAEWASLTHKLLRSDDTVARLGGDEFVIVLPRAARHVALARLDRLKTAAEAAFEARGWMLGLSMGVAIHRKGPPRWSELMARADLQLYRAKEGGRGLIQAED